MARLHTSGAELNDKQANSGRIHPDGSSGTAGATIQTSTVRSGQYAWKFASGAGNAQGHVDLYDDTGTSLASGVTYYFRAYMYFDNLPTSDTDLMVNGQARARLKTTGKLALWNNNLAHQIGSDSLETLVTGIWYRIELALLFNSASDDTAELRLNGVSVASGTEAMSTAMATNSFNCGWQAGPGANVTAYGDDFAINDSTGANQNSWPGPGNVVLLLPVGDNARVGWTQGDGTSTTALWDCVDNLPPQGAATGTATNEVIRAAANTTDTYTANLTTYANAGIDPWDTLNAITIMANHAYSFAAAATLGLTMSNPAIGEITGVTNGSAVGTYPSNWSWVTSSTSYGGTLFGVNGITYATQPTLQIRKGTSSSTRTQYCDAMGVYVDFIPQTVPCTPPIHLPFMR